MDKQYKIAGLGVGGIGILLSFALKEAYYPLFFVLPFFIMACVFLLNTEISAILNASEYISTVIEKAIFKKNNKLIGWETWLSENPEKVKVYEDFRSASLAIFAILYVMCVFAICYYLLEVIVYNIVMEIVIILSYVMIGIFTFTRFKRRQPWGNGYV